MSGRAAKVAEAQRLRADGLTLKEIGRQMGCAFQTVHQYLTDPDLTQLRARKDRYRGTCCDCGAETGGSGGLTNPSERCKDCSIVRTAELQRAAGEERAREMLRLRREGHTNVDIAERVGMSCESVSRSLRRLRAAGEDVPASPYWRRAA